MRVREKGGKERGLSLRAGEGALSRAKCRNYFFPGNLQVNNLLENKPLGLYMLPEGNTSHKNIFAMRGLSGVYTTLWPFISAGC